MSLSSTQSAELTRALDALARRVQDELQQAENENFRDLAGEVHDTGEESVAATVEDTRHSLQERQMRELREVDAARQRLVDGSFGICTDCGQEIPYQRLLAYPIAVRCVACQSRHETVYIGGRVPTL